MMKVEMNHQASAVRLIEAIEFFRKQVAAAPPGWRPLLNDSVRAFLAVWGPRSSGTLFASICPDGSSLCIIAAPSDPVLDGIARKAEARAMQTCCICGRRGRRVRPADFDEVLCPRCEAPIRLAQVLEDWLATADGESTSLLARHELPPLVQVLVPQGDWQRPLSNRAMEFLPHDAAARLRWRCRAVHAALRPAA